MSTANKIRVTTGDLLASDAQTLVNTVNCVGVMGKGIALAFRHHFPDMYADYVKRCERGEVRLGEPYLYKRVTAPWVLNFPTKGHWRSVSRLSDIAQGLKYLQAHYRQWGIESIAVPPLGCGNGQLEWNVVGPTIYRALRSVDIPVVLYAPHGTPASEMTDDFLGDASSKLASTERPSKINPGLVALVGVISRICNEKYHWPLNRIALQKIAYFLTELGVPTGLEYRRGSYGPFASDLKRVIAILQNHELVKERQVGKSFRVSPGPTYADARAAYMRYLKEWAPQIEKVADLFLRLPSSSDMEIAATVHFVSKELHRESVTPSEQLIFQEVLEWKKRRRPPLKSEDVAENIRSLNMLGWIDAEVSDELPVQDEQFA